MKILVVENNWLPRGRIGDIDFEFDFGWGNGYVIVPKGHHLHGVNCEDINVDVHGGLNFSAIIKPETAERWGLPKSDIGSWVFGFDTAHFGDTLKTWPMERVRQEARRLREQLMALPKTVNSYTKARTVPVAKVSLN